MKVMKKIVEYTKGYGWALWLVVGFAALGHGLTEWQWWLFVPVTVALVIWRII